MIRNLIGLSGVLLCICATGCNATKKTDQSKLLSWSGAQIVGKCLVRSYQEDGAVYVTENQHLYYPDSLRFEVISDEPQGRKTWLLSHGSFTSSVKANTDKKGLYSKEIMQALLFSMSSSTEMLSGVKLSSPEQVKVEGKWYDLYKYVINNTTIELFQNKFTKRYELVTVKNSDIYLQAYSYNLWYDKNLGRQVPRTIDVFDISNGFASKKLIIQVQYVHVESLGR